MALRKWSLTSYPLSSGYSNQALCQKAVLNEDFNSFIKITVLNLHMSHEKGNDSRDISSNDTHVLGDIIDTHNALQINLNPLVTTFICNPNLCARHKNSKNASVREAGKWLIHLFQILSIIKPPPILLT